MDTSVPPLKHQDCGRAEGEPCSVLTRLPRARSGGHGHRSWRVGLWVGVCKCQHLTPEDSGVDDRHQRQGRTAAMTPRTHSPLRSFRQPSAPANPPLLAPNNYQRHHMAATGLPFPLELIGIFCSWLFFFSATPHFCRKLWFQREAISLPSGRQSSHASRCSRPGAEPIGTVSLAVATGAQLLRQREPTPGRPPSARLPGATPGVSGSGDPALHACWGLTRAPSGCLLGLGHGTEGQWVSDRSRQSESKNKAWTCRVVLIRGRTSPPSRSPGGLCGAPPVFGPGPAHLLTSAEGQTESEETAHGPRRPNAQSRDRKPRTEYVWIPSGVTGKTGRGSSPPGSGRVFLSRSGTCQMCIHSHSFQPLMDSSPGTTSTAPFPTPPRPGVGKKSSFIRRV